MNLIKAENSSFKRGLLKNQLYCHSERSEESVAYATSRINREILRLTTQDDIVKTFFNGLKFVFLFLLILMTISFFDLKKAKAIVLPSQTVVINEVEYDPPQSGTDSAYEWFELYNKSLGDIPLDGWTITDNSQTDEIPSFNLKSKNFLVIAASEDGFKINFTDLPGNFIDMGESIGGGLSNTGDHLILKDQDGNIIDQISWGNDKSVLDPAISKYLEGHSIERKPVGIDTNSSTDFIDQPNPTPGSGIPQSVILQNPRIDNASIILEWSKADSESFAGYEIYLSEKSGEIGHITDYLDGVKNNFYQIDNLDTGLSYFLTIRNYNLDGNYSDSNQVSATLPIIYSKSIIINEVLPHPENGANNEFIELYNSGDEEVDLSDWFLDDAEGDSTPFKIPDKLLDFPGWTARILPGEYKVFYRYQTGIALNDSGGDTARLLFPDGKMAYAVTYKDYATLGFSCIRGSTDICSWTTTPTAGEVNIISLPKIDDPVLETEPVINTIPIEISTGDYQNYLDKLVKIRGKVISTSGNTFYLDDGSGVIKVYIQEKTGIVKPEMHRNDIFEIIGVVDLYGQTWRILPRTLNDIALIEKAPVVTKTATAKKTVVKKVVSKAVTAVKSPLISKAVAAASTSPPAENNDKNNTLSQLIKTSIGLAILFLVFLIIKILHQPKVKSIGGHFGDDET